MYRWFESRLNPFPAEEPTEPPKSLFGFFWHYTRPAWHYVALTAVVMALIAVMEVWMFSFLGNIIDWLSAQNRETFLQTEKWHLAGIALVVLVALPGLVTLSSLLTYQTLFGNYPMRIRWQVHRYLLKQSMAFYQDEFAGRIATKLMQTALAVRETVIKFVETLNYVVVYFLGMLVIVGSADWRLAPRRLPCGLLAISRRCAISSRGSARVAEAQADARSTMTGPYRRQLHQHPDRQALLACAARSRLCARGHGPISWTTVYRQGAHDHRPLHGGLPPQFAASFRRRRPVDLAVARQRCHHRRGRRGHRPRAQAVGHVAVDHVGGLGAVREYRHGAGRHCVDLPAPARRGQPGRGRPRSRRRARSPSSTSASITARAAAVIEDLSLTIAPGEKVGLVGRSGAGKSTLVNLLLRFYDLEGGSILIDGQDIAGVTQESLRAHIGMVTQDTSLLHRSVRDNILYGRPDASEAMMIEAARKAEAQDFILDLSDPKGRRATTRMSASAA